MYNHFRGDDVRKNKPILARAKRTTEYADEIATRLCISVGYQRVLRGYSINQLSRLSSVDTDTIKRIEAYKVIPDIQTIVCLLHALGFKVNMDNLDDY